MKPGRSACGISASSYQCDSVTGKKKPARGGLERNAVIRWVAPPEGRGQRVFALRVLVPQLAPAPNKRGLTVVHEPVTVIDTGLAVSAAVDGARPAEFAGHRCSKEKAHARRANHCAWQEGRERVGYLLGIPAPSKAMELLSPVKGAGLKRIEFVKQSFCLYICLACLFRSIEISNGFRFIANGNSRSPFQLLLVEANAQVT